MSDAPVSRLTAFWSVSYFPALDGLRALSILLVFFVHIHVDRPDVHGWLGVYIFFVLSGFLITTLLIRESEDYGSISLRGFYVRRFFRIAPIYFLALALYFPAVLLLHDAARWTEFKLALPYLITFMQEYRPAASGLVFGQAWSLGIEEKFYLVWPLLTICLLRFRKHWILIALAIATGLVALPQSSMICYGSLSLGSLMAIVLARSTDCPLGRMLSQVPAMVVAFLCVAAYMSVWLYFDFILLFSASVAVLIGNLVLRLSWLRSLLEHPWVVLAGKRSYAMYLIHVLVIHVVERVAAPLHALVWYVIIPISYLASFAGATVLFYLVERPCLAYGRRISKRINQQRLLKTAELV